MSLSDLHTELGLNSLADEARFWSELDQVARNYSGTLGPEAASSGGATDELAALAEELGKERVSFGPNPEVTALDYDLFAKLGYQTPPNLAELMKDSKFYLLNIPITLLPWDPLESTCRHASLSIL